MKPAIKKEELGADNEWGTPELTNKYKSETPGQTPKAEATNDTIRNVVKQNAHLYRDNELARQSREDDTHKKMADIDDLHDLLSNPPEEYAKRQYGSVQAYKKMIQGKIDRLKNEGLEDACWKGYKAIGTKEKDGKTVPNCVPESLDFARQVKMAALITGERNKALLESFIVTHPITDRHLEFTAIRAEFNKFKKLHEAKIGQDDLYDLIDSVRRRVEDEIGEHGLDSIDLDKSVEFYLHQYPGLPTSTAGWKRYASDIADSIITDYHNSHK